MPSQLERVYFPNKIVEWSKNMHINIESGISSGPTHFRRSNWPHVSARGPIRTVMTVCVGGIPSTVDAFFFSTDTVKIGNGCLTSRRGCRRRLPVPARRRWFPRVANRLARFVGVSRGQETTTRECRFLPRRGYVSWTPTSVTCTPQPKP
jgi:hypothetical protein